MTSSIVLVLFDRQGVLSLHDRDARVRYLSAISGQSPQRLLFINTAARDATAHSPSRSHRDRAHT
jgi:hypothetical protein